MIGLAFVALILAALAALLHASTSEAQGACATLCVTLDPTPQGQSNLRVDWPGSGGSSSVAAYALARLTPGAVSSRVFAPGPGSFTEPAPAASVCYMLVPVVYSGQGTGLRSTPPICYYPLAASSAPLRLSVSVMSFSCDLCPVPVALDRVRLERLAGVGSLVLAAVPLGQQASAMVWRAGPTDPSATGGIVPPACYFGALEGPAPLMTGVLCSQQGSVPAVVSDLPTPTPTPLPPTVTPVLTPIATVTAGTNPNVLAVNARTNRVYVSDTDGMAVIVVDGATNAVAGRVLVDGKPGQIAVDPNANRAYIALRETNSLVDRHSDHAG